MGDSSLLVVQAASINSEESQVPAADNVPREHVVQYRMVWIVLGMCPFLETL